MTKDHTVRQKDLHSHAMTFVHTGSVVCGQSIEAPRKARCLSTQKNNYLARATVSV